MLSSTVAGCLGTDNVGMLFMCLGKRLKLRLVRSSASVRTRTGIRNSSPCRASRETASETAGSTEHADTPPLARINVAAFMKASLNPVELSYLAHPGKRLVLLLLLLVW